MRFIGLALALGLASIACGSSDEATTSAATGTTGSGGGTSSSATTGSASTGSTGATTSGTTTGASGSTTGASGSTTGGGACSGKPGVAGDFDGTVDSVSGMRTYHAHAPPGYDSSAPTMLVLVFHGFLETSAQIETISLMTPESDASGFLVVYPQGLSDSWNAGACCGTSQSSGVDDTQFVKDLLDDLEARYCVDASRIYATGFSNGGMLSHRLGCEMADRFAAVGGVSGTMAFDPCTPSRPVPVMHVHGTSDLVVPYAGGGFGNADSVDETIAGWVARDACVDAMPTEDFANGDSSCAVYSQCQGGSAVRLCQVEGGGHQWPGGTTSGSPGKLTQDMSASQQLAAFFAAHPMP